MPKVDAKKPSPKKKQVKRLEESPELQELYKRVGQRILEIRKLKGLTQRQACFEVFGDYVMQGNWSRWERGETLPYIATLHQLAVWAGLSLGELGLYESEGGLNSSEVARLREILAMAEDLVRGK